MEESAYRIEKCDGKVQWDEFVLGAGGHPLQLWGWGDLRSRYGWQVDRIFVAEDDKLIAAAQLLIRKLPKPFRQLVYIPRGPVVAPAKQAVVLQEIIAYCRSNYAAVALMVEPDRDGEPTGAGWREVDQYGINPSTTLIDLSKAEGVLFAEQTTTTREYIREAATRGLEVRKISHTNDLRACAELCRATNHQRKNQPVYKDQYYQDLHDKMGEFSNIFGCYEKDQLVACVWIVTTETVAFSLFSGVSERGKVIGADRLVTWEAIRRVKQWGVEHYDLNRPVPVESDLPSDFSSARFEQPGSFDFPLSSTYRLWHRVNRLRRGSLF